ncbi:MAG: flagellar export chaperone FliS [Magnetococcales bacterium]|nr:flagellar export chaperone FliS [Magnetococcales bacterium]MBF0149266.1 flagellar export chaperone FliS [Magnetococcales bacterium]MBF0172799.1 flagellar export chaperone FliS [Magnetococcales bacterium]MBF0348009.1 flagellar export chaperone FliS [Magnetococcales bacterium]MBF0632174.1 flagellar export chaperone FliS [Magnetococcales bacterium]
MNTQLVQSQEAPSISSGLDILIQLYEGCIKFLNQASEACENGRVDDFKDRLQRGQKIIEHFQNTLDYEKGGQVPNQLNDLYTYMLDSLIQSGLTHETDYIQRVVEQLEILLEGWRGARPLILS